LGDARGRGGPLPRGSVGEANAPLSLAGAKGKKANPRKRATDIKEHTRCAGKRRLERRQDTLQGFSFRFSGGINGEKLEKRKTKNFGVISFGVKRTLPIPQTSP